MIAGLIIAIIASMISVSQVFIAGKIARNADKWPNEIQNIVRDVQEEIKKDLKDANVSIKIESNGEKIEINTGTKNTDKEQKLEELEGVNTSKDDTLQKKK